MVWRSFCALQAAVRTIVRSYGRVARNLLISELFPLVKVQALYVRPTPPASETLTTKDIQNNNRYEFRGLIV